ncbi:MAG TPA: hypothetical protein VFI66_04375 [Gemmatimonadales bacterium]|nr:hypothetical protein [Gemmatimonadales bacterium]
MRHTVRFALTAACFGLALGACGEGTAPASEQAQVLAAEAEQLGAMVDSNFGVSGAAATAAASAPLDGGLEAALVTTGADTAPTFWGRLRVVPGGPRPIYHRDVTIQGDTARVEHDLTFDGLFLVDTSADGTFDPSAKPLADRMTQQAVLVRDDAWPHGWRVVALSPQDWTVVDPSRQTVAVTDVQVYRNDTLLVEVTDPTALLDVTSRIPRFRLGDTVRVVAAVTNTTGSGFTPATFAFLHVRHADRFGTAWRRLPMVDNGDGTFARSWIVRRTGIDRFAVDALDTATLLLGTPDNYRANEVAIPYRVE